MIIEPEKTQRNDLIKAPACGVAAELKGRMKNVAVAGSITRYECENFLRLCGQPRTLERIEYMLKKGNALRNLYEMA